MLRDNLASNQLLITVGDIRERCALRVRTVHSIILVGIANIVDTTSDGARLRHAPRTERTL